MTTLKEFRAQFDDFLEASRIKFGFLVRDFGFSEMKPVYGGYECAIGFQRGDQKLNLAYELGSTPSAEWSENISGKWKTQAIEKIAGKFNPSIMKELGALRKAEIKDVDRYLDRYANLVRGIVDK